MLEPASHCAVIGAPRLSRRHLSRPRLLARLDPDEPLTVLRAPAGAGKTALLAEWVRTVHRPGIWVALRQDDGERLPFWRTVTTAMVDAGYFPADALPTLGDPAQDDELLPALRRRFRRLARRHLIVLDNAEVLTAPEILEDILTLVEETATVGVVLAGRTPTTLEAARTALRVDRRVIRPPDLAFTAAEVAALVEHKVIDGAPATWSADPRFAAVVHEISAGHPARVRAVLHRARASSAADAEAVRALTSAAARAEVQDLLDDVSQRPLMTFLLRCSIPDTLPPSLAGALGGDTGDVQENLRLLETMGLLTIDGWSGVASVAPLLHGHLRAEASARLPAELGALHARTASWELAHGTPLPALRHAVASRDYDLVTVVISHHWKQFLWGGIILEAEPVLEEIPRSDLRHNPVISGLLGLAANMNPARRGRAIGYLSLSVTGARQRRRGASRPERLLLDVLESSLLRISGEASGILLRARSAERMLDEWSSDLTTRPSEPVLRAQLAISFFRAGHPREALEVLEDALSAPADNSALALQQAVSIKAGILAHLGVMTASRELLVRAQQLPWPQGLRDSYLGAFYHYAAAWDRIASFDLDGAQRHVDILTPQSVNIELRPYITMLGAYIGALRGDSERELLRLAEHQKRDHADRRTLPAERVLVSQASAVLHLAAGRVSAARRILHGLPTTAGNHTLAATVELAAGRADAALARLALSQRDSEVAPRVHVLQCLVLAAASLRLGDRAGALTAAEQLAMQMRHHGLRVHLAMVPRPDLLAVRSLLRTERPDLVTVLGDLDDVPDIIARRRAVTPLSEREQVVLTELSTGAASALIAERLGVSVNTVKSQLRSTYRKLGASSREEALAIAVREGMLAEG